jgi:hypothetical protein
MRAISGIRESDGALMKVFQMRFDPDHYQSFTPRSVTEYRHPTGERYNGTSLQVWNPQLPPGDFYNTKSNYLITSPRATAILWPHLAHVGETDAMLYRDESYILTNVTLILDVLDYDRIDVFQGHTSGVTLGIAHYAFHADRFPNTSLFKLREDQGREIYVVEGANDCGFEFREAVKAEGLVGVKFRKLWDSETGFRGMRYNAWHILTSTGDDE